MINAREDFSNSLGGDFEIHLYIYIYVCMFLSQSILQSPDTLKYDKCQANLDVRNSYAKYHRFPILKLLNLGSSTTKSSPRVYGHHGHG